MVIFAVGFTTAAVAVVAHVLMPTMPWAAAIALGAVVAPPDAVADVVDGTRAGGVCTVARRLAAVLAVARGRGGAEGLAVTTRGGGVVAVGQAASPIAGVPVTGDSQLNAATGLIANQEAVASALSAGQQLPSTTTAFTAQQLRACSRCACD